MLRRLALTSLVIGVVALAFFLFGIGNPARNYYDEGDYIPATRAFLKDAPNPNPEAPPLGKLLLAAGIKLAGDNPLGWRIASTVCGSLSLVAVFLWTYFLSKDYRIACSAAALTLFNNFLPTAMFLGVAIALTLHSLPRRIFGVRISLLVLSAADIVFLWCYPRMAHLEAPWDCALGCWS
jgi:dolichyl-phosphate-mannose--protein O-mannosyl transferase